MATTMATDQTDNQTNDFMLTDDYLHTDAKTDAKTDTNKNIIELQVSPPNPNDNNEEKILFDKLKSFIIDTELSDDNIDRDEFYKLCNENNIKKDIGDNIFNTLDKNNQSFLSIQQFISWKDELTIDGIKQIINKNNKNNNNEKTPSPPQSADFLSPIAQLSIGIEEKDEEDSTSMINKISAIDKAIYDTNNLEEEKYPLHPPQFCGNEYATKRCNRPVRNNVFMEKTVEECNSEEINFEVERLICCLHFLAEEYNVYHTLSGYLDEIANTSQVKDISSPYAFSQKPKQKQKKITSPRESQEEKVIMLKKSDTAHHIKWLHMAYVTEQNKRFSHKKIFHSKAPNFNNVIHKKAKFQQLYQYLKSIWRDTIVSLTQVWKKENELPLITESSPISSVSPHAHYVSGSKAQNNLMDQLKKTLAVKSGNEIIKKLSTFSSEDEGLYPGHEDKYDPIYSCTPTCDEMVCYESLCRVLFNDSVSASHFHGSIGDFQKIKQAFSILRANDHAIAAKTSGWVTTIDNILSVLLYRDLSWYSSNFIGELRISLVIQGTKTTKLGNYENKERLTAIKQSIIYSFCGVPKLPEAEDNVFDINHIILRQKKTEHNNFCSCSCGPCGQQAHLARLTFGILCDDSKCIDINVMNPKFNKQFPYKFLFQSKRLFELIYRNKFIRLFDSSARKQGAQLKLAELHTYDLSVFEYPKYEIDNLLTAQFALPSTSNHDINSNSAEVMRLHTHESRQIQKHIQQQEAVENYFLHAFDTSNNLVEFGDTIIEEDYSVMLETRVVNFLNKFLSLIHPSVVYSKSSTNANTTGMEMQSMDRNTSNTSDTEMNKKRGHSLFCGHCYLSCAMVTFAIIMAIIVGLGGLNVWLIGNTPMQATIEDILGFSQKMIATEAQYVAQRALFSTQQFIDFTNVLPYVTQTMNNTQIFDTFLDDSLIASPRFDGIIQIAQNTTNNITITTASFIFKKEENAVHQYDCNLNDADTSQNCVNDLYQISSKIWNDRDSGLLSSQTNSYFIANAVINDGMTGGSIWFITWRYINTTNFIIGAIFDSDRINQEYALLTFAKEGIVYWITNDEYKHVFVTSLNDQLLYITQQHENTESSINLDTTFGYIESTEYKINKVDARITNTMQHVQISDDNNDYYIYSKLQNATFGTFYTVVVFPKDNVYERLIFGRGLIILFTIIAVIFAVINACIANAVPLIPFDDSWLATPLFTEEDKRKLNEAVEREKAVNTKERRQRIHEATPIKQSLPAKLTKVISKKVIFKPMVTQTIDIPLVPIAQSVSRNKSLDKIRNEMVDNYQFNNRDVNRQRSNSDQMVTELKKKKYLEINKFGSKADAIQKMQQLADTADYAIVSSVPLKTASMYAEQFDNEDDDDDDDDGPPPGFGRAVSVATGSGLKLKSRAFKKNKKESKELVKIWKKNQQKKQLQRNINNADMRSIFSREESKYKTKYGQRVNTAINVICALIAVFVVFAYLALRTYTQGDIELIMKAYLNMSNIITENHAEFKVYQHELALQEGQILIDFYQTNPYDKMNNDKLLSDFYHGFDDQLTGIFTFIGEDNDITNLSLYGSANEDNPCVEIYEITDSFLATCIVWTRCNESYKKRKTIDVTDCTLYKAIHDTYQLFDNKVIAWSVPFTCFGGAKVCYVALTQSRKNAQMYVGTLLSMHNLADFAYSLIWEESGMKQVVEEQENKILTTYTSNSVSFSFYMFTHSTVIGDGDYLLAVTGNDMITTLQTTYGLSSSIMRCNESTNSDVQSTYNYLNQTSQIVNNHNNKPVIAWSSWSYPCIVYSWYENEDSQLNWRVVITIGSAIFLGDHVVYSTLGSISVIGWVIIYLFMHFIIYRRFQENIGLWEELYMQQIMHTIRHVTASSDSDEEEDDCMDLEEDDKRNSETHINQEQSKNKIKNNDDEELDEDEQLRSLDFISENIRGTVRESCEKSWIRQQASTHIESELPTKRKDITDHYHKRALRHIYQAKRGMNIITVVQMEKYGQSKEYRLKLYSLQSSRSWRYLMQILIIIHILLVFWRPLTKETLEKGFPEYALYVEILCLVFECFDLILTGFIQFKWQNTKMNPLMSPSQQKNIYVLRGLIWLLIVIDVILIVMAGESFTRLLPLRPFLLILSNDKLIGACYALAITSINAADALLLFIMLLGIAAVSGVILFRFTALMDVYNVYSFQNAIRSIFTTYVFIISGENYGEIVYVSFEESPFLISYFVICTVLGTWIVVSLVVSRFQTSFKQIYNQERERRLYFKRTGYVAAFSLINLDNDNEVSKTEFESFVQYIKHSTDIHEQIKQHLQFENFDTDGDDSIDIREFVTKLEEIYQKPTLIDIIQDDDTLLAWIQLHIVETEAFSQLILVIIFIEIILFALFGIYPGAKSTEMLDLILGITVLLNGLDIVVKIFSMGWNYYWNTSKCRIINRRKLSNTSTKQVALKIKKHEQQATLDNVDLTDLTELISSNPDELQEEESDRVGAAKFKYEESVYTQNPLHLKQREFAHRFDLVIVTTAILSFIVTRLIVQQFWFSDEFNTARIVMVIPLLRLFTLIKTTRSAVYIITKVIPRFASLVIILLLLFYIYAVVGVWLIGDDLKYLLSEPQYSFETFPDSLVTLFQLTVGEGWHDIMYATVYAKNSLLVTSWYFLTFVLIITLIFTNLFVGLVISVVDDVETENKTKSGQLRQDYQQQQTNKKSKQKKNKK